MRSAINVLLCFFAVGCSTVGTTDKAVRVQHGDYFDNDRITVRVQDAQITISQPADIRALLPEAE